MPNLVITIEGGVMNGVMTDDDPTSPVRIILLDFDNIKEGDDPNGAEFEAEIDIQQVTEIFAAHDAPTPEPDSFGPPTNKNVLGGLRCPKCGYENQFGITCITAATVIDDGIDDYGDMEWEGTSGMTCHGCDFDGTIADFTIGEQREDALS